ncbi:UPF0481 protein At3g47200-like [Magnolia sinica]|uniref:UPF0481 protein At3g47200-like n=1 Tax=Magnolia sinica TaxID=86752 RepID=UPI0026581A8D|nr:UPF0481 protein At3g47200-like [Magnolia sinica]
MANQEGNIEEEKDHDAWLNSMTSKVQSIGSRPSQTDPCTIYRVPSSIRQGDTNAYEPQIVSIGPYHQAKQSLQAMQEHKWHHLHALISQNRDHSLADYVKEIHPLEHRARSCYSENIKLGSQKFLEMMVLDGCFIIELLLNVHGKRAIEVGPIYSTEWMVPLIRQDMLLLENQLPFFILQRLFDLINRSNSPSLVDLALNFFNHIPPRNEAIPPSKVVHHLLHLFHSHIIPTPSERSLQVVPTTASGRRPPLLPRSIPSTREIQQAGIVFKKTKAGSFLDVTYRNFVIKIPALSIYDSTTNTLFRNMIALEQCYPESGTYFTSYAIFMHCILQTTTDVMVLKQCRIIEHWLGSDEEVVHLFNRMCKGLTIDFKDNYLSGLTNRVAEICETDWHGWRARLMRNYFSSPWSILQLEAMVLVLVFTVVQTFLVILAYSGHPRP